MRSVLRHLSELKSRLTSMLKWPCIPFRSHCAPNIFNSSYAEEISFVDSSKEKFEDNCALIQYKIIQTYKICYTKCLHSNCNRNHDPYTCLVSDRIKLKKNNNEYQKRNKSQISEIFRQPYAHGSQTPPPPSNDALSLQLINNHDSMPTYTFMHFVQCLYPNGFVSLQKLVSLRI